MIKHGSSKSIPLNPTSNENVGVGVSFSAKGSGINMRPILVFHTVEKEEFSNTIM